VTLLNYSYWLIQRNYGSMSKPADQIGFAMPLESKRTDYAKLMEAF
jgi:hypothetical protein